MTLNLVRLERGSLEYAVAAIGAGALMSINPHINFWIASATGIIFLLINVFLKVEISQTKEKDVSNISMKDSRFLFKNKVFWF